MRRDRSPAFSDLFQVANALQQSGRLSDAVGYYALAIQANGNVPDVHNNIACALLALGRLDEARFALSKALDLRPEYAAALDNLGLVHARLEQHDEALELHQRACAIEPANAAYKTHAGLALLALRRFGDARTAFAEALELDSTDPRPHNGLGTVLDQSGRTAEAAAAFRAALAANPNFGDAACNLGSILVATGDIAGATALFERAVALEPRNGRFHLSRVLGRSGAIEPRELAAMEQLAVDISTLPRSQQIDLHFALAKAYETAARYDDAFRHLSAGNALKRRSIRYDETDIPKFSALLEQVFTEPLVRGLRGWGNPSARPIFVFGMPRSGTTLVEQVLASQPGVAGAGELPVLGELARELWQRIADGMPFVEFGQQIRGLGDRYLMATDAAATDATHVTDKMPGNFWYAPLIHLALPNARMIHVQRDRLDTCVSCFSTLFADESVPYAYDLGELGRAYRAYEQVMEQWRTLLPPTRFIEIHYERLVDDFAGEARRLMTFCGLRWSADAPAFHEVRRTVRTASNIQVRRPLYRSALGRSQRFAAHLGPLLEALSTERREG